MTAENSSTIRINRPLTSNPTADRSYNVAEWLKRSRQEGARHPLDPLGVCMVCGDHKIGHWEFMQFDPDESPVYP